MIRQATKSDIPALIRLLYQADAVHNGLRPDLFKSLTPKYDERELENILSDATKPIFVYDDARVLGHIFCQIIEIKNHRLLQDIKTLYVDDICVDESVRGKHIGRALCEHARDYARTIGCYNITLNVWGGNDTAMRFYESMGFKVQKTGMEVIL